MRYLSIILCFFVFSAYKKVPCCIGDNGVYPSVCIQAVEDPAVFAQFKRNPYYNLVAAYGTYEEGEEHLAWIKSYAPTLLKKMEQFRTLDAIGEPATFFYEGVGEISPTTLHYIKVAADIIREHGSLEGLKVLEIGAGYGGLCKVLSEVCSFQSYTLVDLPEPLALAKKCLDLEGVKNVHFLSFKDLAADSYDLVISHYGFSECDKQIQEVLFKKGIAQSQRGYLTCNLYPKHFRVRPLGKEALLERFSKCGIAPMVKKEEPQMGKDHFIITWREKSAPLPAPQPRKGCCSRYIPLG